LKFLFQEGLKSKQISFIAPKNIAKLAVKRNFLRRRGYAALKKYLDRFPLGFTGVFVFKKSIDSVSEIAQEIEIILNKLKI
jgi:ribonuclease P protein component